MAENANDLMDKLAALCKRRGFIFQSSEIYGGINGFWDYGPLGVELKRNIKEAWWEDIVRKREDMVGLDCSIIMNPKVWEASGHVTGFNDPMVDDKETKERFRADQVFGIWLVVAEGEREIEVGGLREALREGRFFPPAASVLASSEEEAFALAMSPKEVRWAGSLISHSGRLPPKPSNPRSVVESDVALTRGGKVADWTYQDTNGNRYWAFLWRISRDVLMRQPENVPSPFTGKTGVLTQPRQFNLMFQTHYGPVFDEDHKTYLRPETAQGIFANYRNVLDTSRLKIPFGIAQIGKAFRNEINPRNYTFRSREFEQMEIEFFCHRSTADDWYAYWRDARFQWYVGLGLTSSKLRLRDHTKEELAHYASACADIEYDFPFGINELEGVANRTDYDLTQHQKFSGRDMTYFDDQTKERYIPYVIEPSGGVDRAALAFLCEAYAEDTAPDEHGKPQPRTLMRFHPRLAPTKAAVFPLVKKDGMPEIATRIHADLKASGLSTFYDEKGAVGRRYRRQDEAGTPFCITVDGQTLADQTVTVRDRDTLRQERIAADKVVQYVKDRLR
jgi:glycyl-tRNA synthetase